MRCYSQKFVKNILLCSFIAFLVILLYFFSFPENSDTELVIGWDTNKNLADIGLTQLLKFFNLHMEENGQLLNSDDRWDTSLHHIQDLEPLLSQRKYCKIWRNLEKPSHNFSCVKYNIFRGEIPICTYSNKEDNYISSSIQDSQTWEPDSVAEIGRLLLQEQDAQFVDIGANIGVFAIYVAALGRKVVAVEPLGSNLERLHKSLQLSNLLQNVILVQNAISDERKEAMLEIPRGNIGGAYLRSNQTHEIDTMSVKVQTVLLSDLLEVIDFNTAILKIDAEGHELNILKGASEFFQVLNVKYILMEWLQHRMKREGLQIINILLNKGFLPSTNVTLRTVLNPATYNLWPDNIYWMKR